MSLQPATRLRSLPKRATSAGKGAGAHVLRTSDALVQAVGRLAERAIDHVLLTGERVSSAVEAKRRLAGNEETESLAEDIQRVVVLAVPAIRALARGARLTRIPWVIVASSAVSVGIAVRTGVREVQVLAALVAHRLEEETGAPADPALVKKLAIDLYLRPKSKRPLADDKLRLVRLTRKWVFLGAIGRKTSKRAAKAFDAAERLDAATLHDQWVAMHR
jgi:hypothetical protein